MITAIFENKILMVSVFSLLLAQGLKVITNLFIYGEVNLSRAFGSGGMPSSHSSFVSSLTTMVGFSLGFDSPSFAMAFVFASIVMYDASGVRMAVGKQARVLNELRNILGVIVSEDLKPDEKMKELVGHTKLEVLAGCLLGIIIAYLAYIKN